MQRWTIIVGRLAFVVRLSRCTAERRLAILFFVSDFATILDGCQARLHLIEFRGSDYVLVLRRKDLGDLVLGMLHAIWRCWMRRECLGQCAGFLLLGSFDLFEKIDHRLRIVSAGVEILRAQIVGLGFESPRELHKGQW